MDRTLGQDWRQTHPGAHHSSRALPDDLRRTPGLSADDSNLRAIARGHPVVFPTVGTLLCAGIFAEVTTPGVVRHTDEVTVIAVIWMRPGSVQDAALLAAGP